MRNSKLLWKSTFKLIILYQPFSIGDQNCNKFKWMWMHPRRQPYLDFKTFYENSILNHFIHINPVFLVLFQSNLCFFRYSCVWKRKIYCWTLGGNENEKNVVVENVCLIEKKTVLEKLNRSNLTFLKPQVKLTSSFSLTLRPLHLSWRASSSSFEL